MERRNFFKNLFALGVIATIPKYDFSNPEKIIATEHIKPDFETPVIEEHILDTTAKLYKKGKLVAYCGGAITFSMSSDIIDVTSLNDSSNYRQCVSGRSTTTIQMEKIVCIDAINPHTLYDETLKLVIVHKNLIITIECFLMHISTTFDHSIVAQYTDVALEVIDGATVIIEDKPTAG
jgi:hypothetical protein